MKSDEDDEARHLMILRLLLSEGAIENLSKALRRNIQVTMALAITLFRAHYMLCDKPI